MLAAESYGGSAILGLGPHGSCFNPELAPVAGPLAQRHAHHQPQHYPRHLLIVHGVPPSRNQPADRHPQSQAPDRLGCLKFKAYRLKPGPRPQRQPQSAPMGSMAPKHPDKGRCSDLRRTGSGQGGSAPDLGPEQGPHWWEDPENSLHTWEHTMAGTAPDLGPEQGPGRGGVTRAVQDRVGQGGSAPDLGPEQGLGGAGPGRGREGLLRTWCMTGGLSPDLDTWEGTPGQGGSAPDLGPEQPPPPDLGPEQGLLRTWVRSGPPHPPSPGRLRSGPGSTTARLRSAPGSGAGSAPDLGPEPVPPDQLRSGPGS